MEFFTSLDWKSLLLAAVITTFVVSAINTIQTKLSSNWLVFITSFVITFLNTTFSKGMHFVEWQKVLSQLLFTMAFSVLFYNYAGKWFVDKLFDWLRKMLQDKFQKATPADEHLITPPEATQPEVKP